MAGSPANGGVDAARLGEYADLQERLVLLIRQSAAVQEARMDILLDATVLAAEQVQDVRLVVLETPAEVSGWELWGEIALGFLLDTKLAGKLLGLLTRKLIGQAVRTNTLFSVLPRSESGKELAFYAKYAFRDRARRVVREGIPELKLPGLSDKDGLSLYNASLQMFVAKGSGTLDDFANAALKAANARRKAGPPRTSDPIPVADSAGVTVLSAAQDYARATRLGIRFRHAALESYVRRGASPASLALVAETVGWDGLDDGEQQAELMDLTTARNKYRLLLEALIWARLYDFTEAPPSPRSNPVVLANQDLFHGPSGNLQKYWRARFQPLADQYLASKGATVVPGDNTQSLRLRKYFAAVSYQVTQQSQGAQGLMTALKALS